MRPSGPRIERLCGRRRGHARSKPSFSRVRVGETIVTTSTPTPELLCELAPLGAEVPGFDWRVTHLTTGELAHAPNSAVRRFCRPGRADFSRPDLLCREGFGPSEVGPTRRPVLLSPPNSGHEPVSSAQWIGLIRRRAWFHSPLPTLTLRPTLSPSALLPGWRLASFGENSSMPNWRLASFGADASAAKLAVGFVRRGGSGFVGRFGDSVRSAPSLFLWPLATGHGPLCSATA
jgi:hypothetical protein